VLNALPVPEPNPRFIAVHVAGPCDRVQVCLYTRAMVCLAKVDGPGAVAPGWIKVSLPIGALRANGAYHYTAQSFRGAQGSLELKRGTLMVLH
jgi:hypothetical protein